MSYRIERYRTVSYRTVPYSIVSCCIGVFFSDFFHPIVVFAHLFSPSPAAVVTQSRGRKQALPSPPHYGSCLASISRKDLIPFFPRRLASNYNVSCTYRISYRIILCRVSCITMTHIIVPCSMVSCITTRYRTSSYGTAASLSHAPIL